MNPKNTYQPASFGLSDVGVVRDHNEDSLLCLDEHNTWIICGGMGGHKYGEVASQIAIDNISEVIKSGKSLVDSIQLAHQAIIKTIENQPDKEGMGTTAIVLQWHNDDYEIAWVGDSRGYLFDGKSLTQLSTDHSLVQSLVDNGSISPEQASRHPKKNIITQSLGYKKHIQLKVDNITGRLYHGQLLMLCSDGLTTELSDQDIESELSKSENLEELTSNLISAAKNQGGSDNISVILVKAHASAPEASHKIGQPVNDEKNKTLWPLLVFPITIVLILCLYFLLW